MNKCRVEKSVEDEFQRFTTQDNTVLLQGTWH